MESFKIALVGNTNVGKTTLLNTICGLNQETSNYPGTTVEFFKAKTKYKNVSYEITDLPGTYSLTPFTEEEKVAREILQKEKFDLVIQVIEPNFKKRSLSFTLELMELELPLFLVVNNKNHLWKQADCFIENLERKLGISGLSINALDKQTKSIFFDKIQDKKPDLKKYQNIINRVHKSIESEIENAKEKLKIDSLWVILKILENDQEIVENYAKDKNVEEIYKNLKDKDYLLEIKNNRFGFIENHLSKCLGIQGGRKFEHRKYCCDSQGHHLHSDKIDKILLNKWFGIPFFLILMWFVFQVTFTLGAIPMDIIDGFVSLFQEKLSNTIPSSLFSSVLIEGVIGGVGATLVFLPPIMLLFFFLSILQQSGYLARTAYLLDNVMQKIGLGGKSFVPLLMGFGCSVPAIMATRTLSTRKEKIITAMMLPFMSCGAKLPVYTLFVAAFFAEEYQGSVLFALYIFGILMGILSGLFFSKFIKNKNSRLFLELPAYTFPKIKNVWRSTWNAAKEFLYKVGRIILPLSILLWFLFSFPIANNGTVSVVDTYAVKIGKSIEPLFKPLGFDWRISIGLVAGLGAKEVFVATFGTLYSLDQEDEEGVIKRLQNDPIFTPLTVVSLLVFILLYTPCLAVIATLKQEFGTRWAIIGFIYPFVLAWFVSFAIYQIGLLF